MARSSVRPAARGSHHGAGAEGSPANVCLLSNGRYTVMLTQAGSGYSTCDGIDVTRWREDATSDCWGQFFIRDLDGGDVWSAGRQPLAGNPDDYETILGSDWAVFKRRDGDIETRSEIAVAADADAEVRRITLTNHGVLPRILDMEVSLRGGVDQIELTVRDFGAGFDVSIIQGRGLGLTSMKERVRAVGGRLTILSEPQRGTTVHTSVPLG